MEPIERHIKQHFDNKSYSYNEAHWSEAQKLIAENKRRRRGWLYWWLGGVSMIFIASFTYWTISNETKLVTDSIAENIESTEQTGLGTSKTRKEHSFRETPIRNTGEIISENSNISQSSIQTFNDSPSSKSNTQKSGRSNAGKNSRKERNNSESKSPDKLNLKIADLQEPEGISGTNVSGKNAVQVKTESAPGENKNQIIAYTEILKSDEIQRHLIVESKIDPIAEAKTVEESSINTDEEVNKDNASENVEILPITPVAKNAPFSWGFVAGYLMQKRFTEDQLLNGAYLGARASWNLSSKWSIGSDLSLVIQEIESVHMQHEVATNYGFGRDSIVTDLYAKRAITLQIPLAVSYAIGKHTFTGMLGSRILLDAKARIQKLHYTNADPENTGTGVIVSRSTVVTKKEQLMPRGALAPFSIYSGIRYGWMIGKGWGLETNITMPLYHKESKLDFGTKMAADQGIRLELGVMKVF